MTRSWPGRGVHEPCGERRQTVGRPRWNESDLFGKLKCSSVAEHSKGRWGLTSPNGATSDHVEFWILNFILKTVGSNESKGAS